VDVPGRGLDGLSVGQHGGGRRLVGDQRPHLLGVPLHQGQRVRSPAAAGEDVHCAGIQSRDEPMEIVGVFLDLRLRGAVGTLAPFRAAGVIGDNHAIGEVRGKSAEARGTHGRPDQQQDWLGGLVVPAHVVGQLRARNVQCVRRRLGHGSLLAVRSSLVFQTPPTRGSHRRDAATPPGRFPGGSIVTEGPDAADAPHTSTGDELDPRLQDPRVRAGFGERRAYVRRSARHRSAGPRVPPPAAVHRVRADRSRYRRTVQAAVRTT
jgi:hypothetical protein